MKNCHWSIDRWSPQTSLVLHCNWKILLTVDQQCVVSSELSLWPCYLLPPNISAKWIQLVLTRLTNGTAKQSIHLNKHFRTVKLRSIIKWRVAAAERRGSNYWTIETTKRIMHNFTASLYQIICISFTKKLNWLPHPSRQLDWFPLYRCDRE